MDIQPRYFLKAVQTFAMLGLFALATQSAVAADAKSLATKNQCMACHKVEGKLIGPAFKDVAAKYKGDASARDTLTAKVRKGGKGTWGSMPMPANTSMSDSDLQTVITWILAAGN